MKNTYLLLATFILGAIHASCLDLKQAIINKQVMVQLTGTNNDEMPAALAISGFSPKMQLSVYNPGNEPVSLELEPGYMLDAAESGYQAMLLVQVITIKLKPKERRLQYLYAMCTQLSKSAPNSLLKYSFGDTAKPALLQMARFIAAKKYWVMAAQQAVWSLTDNFPLPGISSRDTTIQNEFQLQAASIKGVNLKAVKDDYERQKGMRWAELDGGKFDRNITFAVEDTAMVSVGFYDNQGNLLRSLFANQLFREGKHSIRYNPYPLAFAGKQYAVRMIKDGLVYREYYFMQ